MREELWRFAIAKEPLHKASFFAALQQDAGVDSRNGYYFLKGMEKFVDLRLQRVFSAKRKMIIAQQVIRVLQHIPWILFIGISGSLATDNTKDDDDIDLFVITRNNSVWITRLCVLLLLQVLGKRRKKHSSQVNDTICVNLFMEVSHLFVPVVSQNLYSAHEIAQVRPLYNRNNTYEKFIAVNTWILQYLPHVLGKTEIQQHISSEGQSVTNIFIVLLNMFVQRIQLWYMTESASSAIISDTVLAFYTSTTEKNVLREYKKGIRTYTDTI